MAHLKRQKDDNWVLSLKVRELAVHRKAREQGSFRWAYEGYVTPPDPQWPQLHSCADIRRMWSRKLPSYERSEVKVKPKEKEWDW
jgi:hypothetical protein